MEKVPKIVAERLRTSVRLTSHPDADLLTAFAEGALAQLERATVVEHLARCGECREVVSLSLPEAAPVQPTLQPSRGWLAWPTLRWGFVAAGVLLVASFGVIQYRKQPRASTVAYQAPLSNVRGDQTAAQPATAAKVAEPASAPGSPTLRDSEAPLEGRQSKKKADSAPSTVGVIAGAVESSSPVRGRVVVSQQLPHGPRMLNQLQNNSQLNNLQVANTPAAVPPPPVAKQAPARVFTIAPAAQPEKAEVASAPTNADAANSRAFSIESRRPDEQARNGGQAEAKGEGVQLSSAIVLGGPIIAGSAAAKTGGVSGTLRANTRWAINSSGGLQRSLDHGATWQDVNVAENAQPAQFDRLSKRVKESANESYDDKDRVARTKAANLVFRAVAANGADVWAGASGGILYHSIDSGVTWTRVVPSASGAMLTGEILSVVFSDPQTGVVTTSAPEVWKTADGGQSWQKQ